MWVSFPDRRSVGASQGGVRGCHVPYIRYLEDDDDSGCNRTAPLPLHWVPKTNRMTPSGLETVKIDEISRKRIGGNAGWPLTTVNFPSTESSNELFHSSDEFFDFTDIRRNVST